MLKTRGDSLWGFYFMTIVTCPVNRAQTHRKTDTFVLRGLLPGEALLFLDCQLQFCKWDWLSSMKSGCWKGRVTVSFCWLHQIVSSNHNSSPCNAAIAISWHFFLGVALVTILLQVLTPLLWIPEAVSKIFCHLSPLRHLKDTGTWFNGSRLQ